MGKGPVACGGLNKKCPQAQVCEYLALSWWYCLEKMRLGVVFLEEV